MTLINLDSIQFYQPPPKADLAGKGPSMSSVGDVPVICGEGHTPMVPRSNGGWGGSLNDYDLIEVLDSTGSGGGEEDESFLSFEELMLGAGRAQESQQSGLRLVGDNVTNTDSSSSFHSRSDGSISKQGGRHCSLNTLRTSIAGSEAGYEPYNPR